jgi:hypothetical protein
MSKKLTRKKPVSTLYAATNIFPFLSPHIAICPTRNLGFQISFNILEENK